MRPVLTPYDSPDLGRAYSELCCYIPVQSSRLSGLSYFNHFFSRQLGSACSFPSSRASLNNGSENLASRLPSFLCLVTHVISVCSKKQVLGVATNWIVALVKTMKPVWDFTETNSVCKPVCPPCSWSSKFRDQFHKATVTISEFCGLPNPAFRIGRHVHFFPKPLDSVHKVKKTRNPEVKPATCVRQLDRGFELSVMNTGFLEAALKPRGVLMEGN